MKIIGIYGKMESGKSIVSEAFPIAIRRYISNYLASGNNFEEAKIHYCSISTPLKAEVEKLYGWKMTERIKFTSLYNTFDRDVDFSHTDKSVVMRDVNKTLRQIMQEVGYYRKNDGNENIWIDKTIEDIPNNSDIVIMDGVRYQSDVRRIEEMNGCVIRLTSDEEPANHSKEHVSENDLNTRGFRWTLHNRAIRHIEGYGNDCIRFAAVNNMVWQIGELIPDLIASNKI